MDGFVKLLNQLGFKEDDPSIERIDNTRYRYSLLIKEEEHPFLDYIYLPQNDTATDELFNIHRKL
ncbi:MAG: hypothetical protein ABH886_02660 [Candidatus Desantisbacteria bacterium]